MSAECRILSIRRKSRHQPSVLGKLVSTARAIATNSLTDSARIFLRAEPHFAFRTYRPINDRQAA